MTMYSDTYIQFLRDVNKYLGEMYTKEQKERRRLQDENLQLRDDLSSWEHSSQTRQWNQSNQARS
jgi:hypothetical protein